MELGDNTLDLCIMNPPFTRPTSHETARAAGVPVPSFAGFGNSATDQQAMSKRLRQLSQAISGARAGHGNAGMASNFVDLAFAKTKPGGVMALVLPFAVTTGGSWKGARDLLDRFCDDVTFVGLATHGGTDRAFSADTGMAEVLVVARKSPTRKRSVASAVTWATLRERPASATEAVWTAHAIDSPLGRRSEARFLRLGEQQIGHVQRGEFDGPMLLAVEEPEVAACAEAFDRVGLPEGNFPLAQAALYLATAEKSNSVLAFFDALEAVSNEPDSDVPSHLRDGNRDSEGFGHGAGYLYPHAYRDHWVAQQYLPGALQGRVFYEPTGQGYEARIGLAVTQRREAQLAAMLEGFGAPPEILTFAPEESARDRWLQRTIAQAGEATAALRDRILDGGPLERHSVVLDVNAGSGLLTWEALRRAPEGGVYALAFSESDRQALQEQAQNLDEVERPVVLQGAVEETAQLLGTEEVRFDAIIGRNALLGSVDKEAALAHLAGHLAAGGWLALAETIPRHTQRIYDLGDRSLLQPELAERLVAAEESIYADTTDYLVNWDEETLQAALSAAFPEEARAGRVSLERIDTDTDLRITEAHVRRWFSPASGERKSYAERLAERMQPDEVEQVEGWIRGQLLNRTVVWRRRTVLIRVAGR